MRYLILLAGLCLGASANVLAGKTAPEVEVTTPSAEAPAFEPITQDIGARLDRLEKYLNNSALLDMLDVLEQLKLEVNELRGQIEVQSYNIEQLQKKQRDLYTDVDSRLQRLENNSGGIAATPAAPTAPTAAIEEPTPAEEAEPRQELAEATKPVDPIKAQAEYQRAFRLLKEQQYDQALAAFQQYLKDYPNTDYSDNAQYWLAETNYVMQKYELAINAYQDLLTTYPNSQKASHAMLKIGYSYAELGNTGDAEKALNEVKTLYPGTTAARLATDRLRKLMSNKESNT